MKSLKTILALTYLILIVLLLLNNCNGCSKERAMVPPSSTPPNPDSGDVVRQAEAIGSTGDLKITLLWNFHADIDLHVKQPNGKVIYFKEKQDNFTGGYLDIDNREGGQGAAENIFWNDPPKGQYMVRLNYFGKSLSGKTESGTCTVVVFQEGREPMTYNVNMSTLYEFKDVVSINIQ